MAVACGFAESNATFSAPPGMEESCDCLQVLTAVDGLGNPVIFSCFKLTAEEMIEVQKTGRIWLMICGQGMPPVAICGTKPFDIQEGVPPDA